MSWVSNIACCAICNSGTNIINNNLNGKMIFDYQQDWIIENEFNEMCNSYIFADVIVYLKLLLISTPISDVYKLVSNFNLLIRDKLC